MPRRSGLEFAILLLSVAFSALAFFLLMTRANDILPPEWRLDLTILMSASVALTLGLTVIRKPIAVSIVILLRALIVLLLSVPLGNAVSERILLFSSVLMEMGTYLPLPLSLASIGALSLVVALRKDPAEAFRAALPTLTVADRLVVLVVSLSVAGFSVLLRLVAGRLREGRQANSLLNSAVEKLTIANSEFLQYASVVERESVASERNRITRDLHDIVGQSLTNIIMMMDAALHRAQSTPEEIGKLYQWTRDQAQNCLEETRAALYELRSIPREHFSGIKSIKRLIDTYSGLTAVKVAVEWGNLPWELDEAIGQAVYRLIQESLSNAFRHGRATLVEIHFLVDQDILRLMIRDNGKGGDVEKKGIGHTGMEERVRKLNGDIAFRQETTGYLVLARIPLLQGAGVGPS